MRHLFVVSLVVACAAGCLPDVRRTPEPLEAALRRPPEGDTIFVDSALVERPATDAFCSQELWDGCNEQCVGLERAVLLEDNGLRVARLTAPLPARLQTILNSRRSTIGPRRQRARPDAAVCVAVGPRRQRAAVSVRAGEGRELELTDAQAQFEVTPRLDDGRLALRVTPQLRHGPARVRPRVAGAGEGPLRWTLDTKEPLEELSELTLEMPLEAGEYLLIGPRGDDPKAVGPAFFAYQGDGVPVRQLLILRALPVGDGADADEEDGRTAPLAMQAGFTSARASRR